MAVLTVFLLVVAIWRVTRLLVVDEFPPVKAVRRWVVGTFADVDGAGVLVRGRQWGGFGFAVAYVWTCSWCMSVWAGAVVVGLADVWLSVPVPWLVVAAGSGLTGVLSWVELEHDQRWAARDMAAREREQVRR